QDIHHGDALFGVQRRVGGELEEVRVFDLRDRALEVAAGAELFEDLLEGVVVLAALVVVLVGDAFVAVEEVVLAVTVEQADQQGLEVKAGGAVEAVVYDDPHLTQVLLLPRLQMLTHPAVRAAGLAHVDVMPVLDQVYDRPELGRATRRATTTT